MTKEMNSIINALPHYISSDPVKPGDAADVYRMGLLFGTIEVAEIRVAKDKSEVIDTRGRHFYASDYDFDLPAHDIDEDEQSLVGATLYHKETGKKLTVKYNTSCFVKCSDESGSTALYTPDGLTARADPLTAIKNDLRAAVDDPTPMCTWFKVPEDVSCPSCEHLGKCGTGAMLADILKRLESIM